MIEAEGDVDNYTCTSRGHPAHPATFASQLLHAPFAVVPNAAELVSGILDLRDGV